MSRFIGAMLSVVLCILAAAAAPARAFWVTDGTALCTATGTQGGGKIVPDGSGGAIVTWHDYRSGNYDIYAQRVNASGAVQWTADGVAICTATGNQEYPTIVSDGSGGAIVTWQDYRNGNYDIYIQRVNASGVVQWTANGVALCSATGNQFYPTIVPDGLGGAIATWQDFRNGNHDIYAQRVNAYGTVQWTANGVALCTATADQITPTIASDGSGGAIATWQDSRNGYDDIYAQRVNNSGAVQWTANGVALCAATGHQRNPTIASDGSGGAIATWHDYRNGSNNDIYAQRMNDSGAVQWTADGVPLCTAAAYQNDPTIVSDGSGGAIVTWWDMRNSPYLDIYAQRVNASGAVQWTANGVGICTATGDQRYPTIAQDGSGGAIVTWQDYRNSPYLDIYAQRVNASGAVQWTADGVPLCSAAGNQYTPTIVSDGSGGAIAAWQDGRTGNYDIYAQSIDAQGKTGNLAPVIYAVRDVPGDQGGKVYLSWYGARLDVFMTGDVTDYTIWRAISPTLGALMLEDGVSALEDLSKLDLPSGEPVIRMEKAAGLTRFWELVETVDALYMEAYGKPVATLFDSTAVCTEYHYFQVVAHTADPRVFWKSEPDSGYSADNIAPCPPALLAGVQSFAPEGLNLTWTRNADKDLDNYRVYRGLAEGFVPGPSNLIASPCDTICFDGGWRWRSGYYYKVSAVDVHGNESVFALLSPDDVTGDEIPKAPEASYLSQNYPNPFNPATKIAFGLSAPAHVSLRIYDVSGRLVRELVDETRPAARYEEMWDGRDGAKRRVASGVYFYRLEAGPFTQTRKMILLQ